MNKTGGLARVALLLASTALAAEVGARVFSRVDADGNVRCMGRSIGTLHPPRAAFGEVLERSRERRAYLVHDPDLGWAPAPGGRSGNGAYAYDEAGRRVGPEQAESPESPESPGQLHVGLFGDSFTHGDDVAFEGSLGAALARRLERPGGVRVSNFAVSGYGMDQAFLRWRAVHTEAEFDIVVFGFQAENVLRNLNILRLLLYPRTGLPFSKPRFVLEPDGPRIVNHPSLEPAAIPECLADLDRWPLGRYESFYEPERYRDVLWRRSRLLALVDGFFGSGPADGGARRELAPYTAPGTEGHALARWIVASFRDEVEASGARFVAVHLPRQADVRDVAAGRALEYAPLEAELREGTEWVDPLPEFVRHGEPAELFVSPDAWAHYSAEGNDTVARVLAEQL